MKPAVRRRIEALEARIAALESARPTVELVEWAKVPIGEPLDVHGLLDSVTARYAYGFSDEVDWSVSGYI